MRNLILLTLALLALAAVADSTYTFRVVMTNEDWEETGVGVYRMYTDETGKIWLLGNQSDSTSNYIVRMDTLLSIDTLYNPSSPHYLWQIQIPGYLTESYQSYSHSDSVRLHYSSTGDSFLINDRYTLDSVWITPLYTNDDPWKMQEFHGLEVIGYGGWAIFRMPDTLPNDGITPGALGKYGVPEFEVDMTGFDVGSYAGGYFAVQRDGATANILELTVYDTISGELYSKEIFNYQYLVFGTDRDRIPKKYTLNSDGSVLYLEGPTENLTLIKADEYNEYEFEFPQPDSINKYWVANWRFENNRLLVYTIDTTHHLYLFDTTDSLELLWETNTTIRVEKISFLPCGDIAVIGTDQTNISAGKIEIYSGSDGSLMSIWPNEPLELNCSPGFSNDLNYIFFNGCNSVDVYDPIGYLIVIERGE